MKDDPAIFLLEALLRPRNLERAGRANAPLAPPLSEARAAVCRIPPRKEGDGQGAQPAGFDRCLLVKALAGKALARKVLLERLAIEGRSFGARRNGGTDGGDDDLAQALRNPLHVIKGAAYYLATTEHIQAGKRRDFSNIIAQEVDRLAALVEIILRRR